MSLVLGAVPELWTVVHRHHEHSTKRVRGDRLERNAEFAKQIADELSTVEPTDDIDEMFVRACDHFIGSELEVFRIARFPAVKVSSAHKGRAYDRSAFDDMSQHFRDVALDDLTETDDHRPARTLVLLAAEFTLVPLLEGVLRTVWWWPSTARFDLRAAFHAVTRWATEVDPTSARLVAPALTVDEELRPWGVLSRFYAGVLRDHERSENERQTGAVALSVATLAALDKGFRESLPKGEVMRELLTTAEMLGLMEAKPPRAVDPEALTRSVLAELVLMRDLAGKSFAAELKAAITLLNDAP